MTETATANGWIVGDVADALEHHVATDLAGILHDAGVQPGDSGAALAVLTEEQLNPLLISQCLFRAMALLAGVHASSKTAWDGASKVAGRAMVPDHSTRSGTLKT